MKTIVRVLAVFAVIATAGMAQGQDKKPNILFIMGDDIGIMNVGAYHQGLMVGETPNIDRLAKEGGRFMDCYAMQSCTSGRCAFFTGMYPVRVGLTVPQLPGQPGLAATRHADARQGPAEPWLHDGPVRKEPLGRPR